MLFNSKEFLFGFLPITLIGFYVLVALGLPKLIKFWLIAASVTFYTLWNSQHALLLCALMIVSYGFGQAISSSSNEKTRRLLLGGGVAFNLIVLGWFKYSGFIVSNYELAIGEAVAFTAPLLPLGISFFTFQKIAYLVDQAKRRIPSSDPVDFVLFVTFFPQLIAGPIVHFRQIAPQFNETTWSWKVVENIPVAATMFAIGLAKKVIIADNIGAFIDPIFSYSNYVGNVDLFTSWIGALGYTAQIYFDFSGYSDMAIGAALFFGIRLPINFLSPYKSASIIDFWRRWHITLSNFLREYLYIPLGGSQKGTPRLLLNLIIVMLLGGLWHGARWTFVVWGGLHGTYLAINHGWRRLRVQKDEPRSSPLRRFPAAMLTFLVIVVAWVFFRAQSFTSASRILMGMVGWDGVFHSGFYLLPGGPVYTLQSLMFAAGWIVIALLIAFLAPNAIELTGYREMINADAGVTHDDERLAPCNTLTSFVQGRPIFLAAWAGLALGGGIWAILASGSSEFVYFRF